MIIAELLQLERDEGDEGGRFFLESRKKQRTCVVDGKAAGFKLEVALATPVAGESLNRPDESKLSSVRFLLSPMVWLRQPTPIKIGVPRGSGWLQESNATISDS